MKKRIAALIGVAGLACGAIADHPVNLPGPFLATANVATTVVVSLGGETIPAGLYQSYVLTGDWGNQFGDAFSSEALMGLINQETLAGATFISDPGTGFGSLDSNAPIAGIRWEATMDVNYTGGNPLFLTFLQTFANSSAEWSNVSVTLKTDGAGPNPTPDVTVASIAFPAEGQPTAVDTRVVALSTGTDVKWVKFTLGTEITAINNHFLDIDTQGTALLPTNDTVLAVYDNLGTLVAGDDDDGSGLLSSLTFGGAAAPRAAVGTGLPANGRDGVLGTGDFYMAVFTTGDGEFVPLSQFYNGRKILVSPSVANVGDVVVNFRTGTVTPTTCTLNEVEANNTKATAQNVLMAANDVLCGTTTGTSGSGATSMDYFKVRGPVPAAGKILRNRLAYSSATTGHAMSVRGLDVNAAGAIVPGSDIVLQGISAINSNPPSSFVWYSLGNNPTAHADAWKVIFRVNGTAATTQQYKFALTVEETTPIDAGEPFVPGTVTISSAGVTTQDTDMWLYDSNLNPIAGAGNDDTGALPQSTVTQDLAAGTYYMAIGNFNTANNLTSPASDGFIAGDVMDFPGVILTSDQDLTTGGFVALPADLSVQITDSTGAPRFVQVQKTSRYQVMFVKFTVGAPVSQRCQPADIATDDGTPLPTDTNIHPNGGVNEGDYNSFFQGFFDAAANCDIANDDATPRAPFGVDGVNGGVNEGDYNCFFQKFFDGCPA